MPKGRNKILDSLDEGFKKTSFNMFKGTENMDQELQKIKEIMYEQNEIVY